MRNETLATHHNKNSEEILYPPRRWYESETDILTMDALINSNRGLVQLYKEVQEEDFLLGKTPEALPDNWDEED